MVSEVERLRQRLREVIDVLDREHPTHEIPDDEPCELCSLIDNLEHELWTPTNGGEGRP